MPSAALAQFGDRVVGTLRDHMVDPETPVAARRALPLVLQQIGTQATHAVLGESLLDPDVEVRYGVISALNKLQEMHPTWRVDPTMLETLLDAEILGHLRSYQMIGALLPALADPAPVMAPLKAAMEQELERIFRLLKLRFPHQDLHSAYVGVQSTNPVVHDNALEFLENILSPQLRTQLVPLLDSAVPTRGARGAGPPDAERAAAVADRGRAHAAAKRRPVDEGVRRVRHRRAGAQGAAAGAGRAGRRRRTRCCGRR